MVLLKVATSQGVSHNPLLPQQQFILLMHSSAIINWDYIGFFLEDMKHLHSLRWLAAWC